MHITLSYQKRITCNNGTTLEDVEDLKLLDKYIAENKLTNPSGDKKKLPAIYKYRGKKGKYSKSNLCFIDIDTKVGVEFVLANAEKLFAWCPQILFIQKSHSEKLHIVCTVGDGDTLFDQKDLFEYNAANYVYILKQINNISDDKQNGELDYFALGGVDNTSLQWARGLYLSHYPIIYNENHQPVALTSQKDNLVKEAKRLGLITEEKKSYKPANPDDLIKFNPSAVGSGEKIRIDRNFKLSLDDGAVITGNEVRWRVMYALVAKYGMEGAKEFCVKYFENYKDVIAAATEKTVYPVRDAAIWDLIQKLQAPPELSKNAREIKNYMSEVSDEIIELAKTENRLQIISPTGSGKTTLINGDGNRKGLAELLNAVVIVPYLVTNKLYFRLYEVGPQTGNKYRSDTPLVMVYDQASKYEQIFKDRHVIIDESHELFNSRVYRDSAVRVMKLLTKYSTKVICFSATPLGEVDELNMKVIRYVKSRDYKIPINVHQLSGAANVISLLVNAIKEKYDTHDKIVLFSDEYNMPTHDVLLAEDINPNDILLMRADMKTKEDFIKVSETEYLEKKITLTTRIGYNGLNFRNKNEKIAILMVIQEGSHAYDVPVQAFGRFRDAKDVEIDLYIKPEPTKKMKEVDKVNIANACSKEGIRGDELGYNERYADPDVAELVVGLDDYYAEHAHWNVISDELLKTGYYTINYNSCGTGDMKMKKVSPIKKEASDIWRDARMTGLPIPTDKPNHERYLKQFDGLYYEILSKYSDFVNDNFLYERLKKYPKEKLMDTALRELKDILFICTKPKREYDSYLANLMKMLSKYPETQWFIKGRIKAFNTYRNKIGIITKDTNGLDELSMFLDGTYDTYIDNKKRAGSMTPHKNTVIYTDNGCKFKYDSVADFEADMKEKGLTLKEIKTIKLNKHKYKVIKQKH